MKRKKEQLRELLKIHFSYESFLPGQEEAINNILYGNNTVVVLPTGGGKSMIYQLPALVLEGITIVISPLIALMKDQVDALQKVGIPAVFINSSISLQEAEQRMKKVGDGEFKLLYIAPERFYNKVFVEQLKKIKVSLLAIDEAHCISQWGHDFRPSYLRLKNIIKFLGFPPVVALTATATPEVRKDIITQLSLSNSKLVITGFSRPNLQFAVVSASNKEKVENIVNILTSADVGSGIIYVGTRAKAEDLVRVLTENDIKALSYHAGLDNESRNWVQEQFMNNNIQVIVATNAFGLGINKKDIRFVIHFDLPGTVEAYYQEAGRAGRDGQDSFCILFNNKQDRYLREFFIKGDNPHPNIITEVYSFLLKKLENEVDTKTSILVTYAEIAQDLSENVPEMTIGTSLKILEREGYISRPKDKVSNSFLKINKPWDVIYSSISQRAKSQLEIMAKLEDKYREKIERGWDFNPEEVSIVLKVKKASLIRVIKKLAEQELLEYQPPFRGTEIKVLKIVSPEDLDIDFSALKEKLERAYDKLNEMENYVYHLGCRQKYILKYFGDSDAKACGHCDSCIKLQKNRKDTNNDYQYKEYL